MNYGISYQEDIVELNELKETPKTVAEDLYGSKKTTHEGSIHRKNICLDINIKIYWVLEFKVEVEDDVEVKCQMTFVIDEINKKN